MRCPLTFTSRANRTHNGALPLAVEIRALRSERVNVP